MHEMSLAENMLQIFEEEAHKQGFTKVRTVWLEIGQLACVEKASLQFCFDAVVQGSLADGARLEIIEVAGRGVCKACTREMPLDALAAACPHCGSYKIEVTDGAALRVLELDVI